MQVRRDHVLAGEGRDPGGALHQQYGSVLELVRTLIGVVPNCDPYLEIWPTAFRTYNVLVPNRSESSGNSVRKPALCTATAAASDARNAACASTSRSILQPGQRAMRMSEE